jgi:hypothetical protein
MTETANRIRLNLSSSVKGIVTPDVTVEVVDPTEAPEVWAERRRVALEQAHEVMLEVARAYNVPDMAAPSPDDLAQKLRASSLAVQDAKGGAA